MTPLFFDLSSLILRSLQAHTFDANLEGCSIALELNQGLKTYWIISQGKIQTSPFILKPDFIVSGTLSQWMETLYNPLSPIKGCCIEGDGGLLQLLKENMLNIVRAYRLQWAQRPFLRSLLHQMICLINKVIPPSPWARNQEFEELSATLKSLYYRLDRLQWDLQALMSVV